MSVDTPQVTEPTVVNEPTPTAAPQKPRKANQWITHVKQFRLDNADRIQSEKLSCSQISKLAKATYKAREKCATCGK